MTIVALVTMVLLLLLMCRHLCCCQASVVALVAHCQVGVIALVVMATLPSMRRHLQRCCDCNCCPHDNGVVAAVNAQMSLLLSSLSLCLHNNDIAALDPQQHCCPCHDGGIAVLKLAFVTLIAIALLSSSMSRHPCHNCDGIVALVTMVLLPLMCRHLCHHQDGNGRPCHNGISAVVKLV
jgi:hypothetical protein